MHSVKKWIIASLACVLTAGAVWANSNSIGGIIRMDRLAFASFPAAAALNQGGWLFDTTANAPRWSDATAWNLVTASAPVEDFGGYSSLGASEDTPFAAHIAAHSGTGTALVFTTNIVGTVGGSNAVLEVLQDAVQVCTITFDCAAAVGTITTGACAAAITVGSTIKFQWDATSACTVLPQGNAEFSWQ